MRIELVSQHEVSHNKHTTVRSGQLAVRTGLSVHNVATQIVTQAAVCKATLSVVPLESILS